jgi:hypothetical protein
MGEMLLTEGALLTCSKGTAHSRLGIVPDVGNLMAGRPTFAKSSDTRPFLNIRSFELCTSMANPAVAGMTVANRGVVSPAVCQPVRITPWLPLPATTMGCSVMCAYGGMIKCMAPAPAMIEAQVAATLTAAGLVNRSPVPEATSPSGRQ